MNEEQITKVLMGAMGCERRAHYGNVNQPFCGEHGHYGSWPCPDAVRVAAALAPLILAAQADALREAANATDDNDIFAVGWKDRQWLRARADKLTT